MVLKCKLMAGMLLFFSVLLHAQVTTRISVQGVLKGRDGTAVPDGSQNITFRLYHQSSGGNPFWEESASISINGGVYTHILGSVANLNADQFNQTVYLGVVISGEEMNPRSELTYAPYTAHAQTATTAVTATTATNGVPPGSIMPFAGNTIPNGWIKCDGRQISAAAYPALYAAIGTSWGGDASNFRVPDLRGVFLRGVDDGRGYDSGRALASLQNDATARPDNAFTGTTDIQGEHTHTYRRTDGIVDRNLPFNADNNDGEQLDAQTNPSGAHSHAVSITGGGDAETRPVNVAVYYIIKT